MNSSTKQRAVVERARAEGLLDVRPVLYDPDLAWAAITRVHDPAYVHAVRTGRPRDLAESQGFNWSEAFADAVARIWAGHLAACRLALQTGLVLHPVSGAHHASYTRGGGFCTFNFLAGAGRTLLDAGEVERVLVLDLDAHPGDGTYDLVRGEPRLGVFDIAGAAWIHVPETRTVRYLVANEPRQYFAQLATLGRYLDHFKPSLVQYQAGVDAHEADPLGGIAGMTTRRLRQRDELVIRAVVERGVPLVVNLAGGYQPDEIVVGLHLGTIRAMQSC